MDTTNIFTVTPMSQNIELEAGKTYTGSITVANPVDATENFHYKVEVAPYSVIGEEYTADLATQYDNSQITKWIEIENPTGTLAPNETKKVKFTITVPDAAPAGGQYAALTVRSDDEVATDDDVAINNIFEMASIIYANVAGETVHSGGVSEMSISGFTTGGPIETSATIVNNGNSHELATISLEVRNVFSSAPIYTTAEDGVINEVIMPGTTRYVTQDIDSISPLGIYQVKQTINYLGEDIVFDQTVISCPIWFMVLAAITLVAIIITIIRSIHSKKTKISKKSDKKSDKKSEE